MRPTGARVRVCLPDCRLTKNLEAWLTIFWAGSPHILLHAWRPVSPHLILAHVDWLSLGQELSNMLAFYNPVIESQIFNWRNGAITRTRHHVFIWVPRCIYNYRVCSQLSSAFFVRVVDLRLQKLSEIDVPRLTLCLVSCKAEILVSTSQLETSGLQDFATCRFPVRGKIS